MRIRTFLISTTALVSCALPALANPLGGQVVGGQATISGQGTANVTVNQQTQNAIVNWHTFNIGAGERTQFVQPNATSIILNRVTGGQGPSQIMGTIDANGRVFLVNRDGIIFGAGAQINTAGFLATTSDIRNDDFMAGRYNFSIPGRPDASIVNHGTITATNAGFAALVAPGVRNTGTITAALGTIGLAAGNTFSLDFYGDKLITLGVGDAIATQVKDVSTGQTLKSLVTNEGKLKANGGRVEITAAAARTIVDSVINTSGVIEANSVGMKNGQIVLSAATAGTKGTGAPKQTVKISGTVSAAGQQAGTKGGKIKVTGENIEVKNARIDASGRDGGGTVMIGGDWGGGAPDKSLTNNQSAVLDGTVLPTASTVSVDANSVIDASAKDSGHGGKVILWSDVKTTFTGTILALGGQEFGNGGFVETSSKGQLSFLGHVDTRAPNGKSGTLLLDPDDFSIVGTCSVASCVNEITAGALEALLAFGNMTIATNNTGVSGFGDIFVNAPVTWNYVAGVSGSLTLAAYRHIIVNQNITNHGTGSAGNAIILRADSTGTGTGTVTFAAGKAIATDGVGSIYYNPTGGYQTPLENYSGNLSKDGIAYMLVNNAGQLGLIAATPFEHYALGKSFTATTGTGTSFFSGIFTGDGGLGTNYTISGLNGPLFLGISAPGIVRDLNLAGVNITPTGGGHRGTLANSNDGEISNVTVSGTLNASATDGATVGGLVGFNSATGTITNSRANVAVSTGTADIGDPSNFTRSAHAGGLVGFNFGTISNSSATGTVSGKTNSLIGGLVGTNGDIDNGGDPYGPVPTITNSYATGAVTLNSTVAAYAGIAGGLVGDNWGSITNSYASGNVAVTGNVNRAYAGGLVGQLRYGNFTTGTIANSYASGNVSINIDTTVNTGSVLGGLVASSDPGTTITNAYALGAVSGTVTSAPVGYTLGVGGLVGENSSTITNAYSTGAVSASSPSGPPYLSVGGLIGGNNPAGTVTNGYWDIGTSGQSDAFGNGAVSGVTGLSTAQARQQSTYAGFNFGTDWFMINGSTRPFLRSEWSTEIVNAHQLQLMTLNKTASYKLGGNIDLAAQLANPSSMWAATGFVSIGELSNQFTGVLDGKGWSINGLKIAPTAGTNNAIGLFGAIGANGIVRDLVISGAQVTADPNFGAGQFLGVVAGQNAGLIDNVSVRSSAVSHGTVQNGISAGGIVGRNAIGANLGTIINSDVLSTAGTVGNSTTGGQNNHAGGVAGINPGTIADTTADGTIVGGSNSFAGGLVGRNELTGTIDDSSSSATVGVTDSTGSGAGGLVGFNFGEINSSHATGNVVAGNGTNNMNSGAAGGLVGLNNALGVITNSYATGAVGAGTHATAGGLVGFNNGEITDSHAAGAVAATNSYVGGLVGFNAFGGMIDNSYATGAVAGFGFGIGGFVGSNQGSITNSYSNGIVSLAAAPTPGEYPSIGGFAGENDGTISNSHVNYMASVFALFNNAANAGGFVGGNTGTITGSYTSASVMVGAGNAAGGFAGSNDGTIASSQAYGSVTGGGGSFLGGFVAGNLNLIVDSKATGNVTSTGANSVVGGFAAYNDYLATIRVVGLPANTPISTGTVTGTSDSYLGGLVGYNYGLIQDSHSSSNVVGTGGNNIVGGLVGLNFGVIDPSYSTGNVSSGSGSYIGNLVGANGALQFPNGTTIVGLIDQPTNPNPGTVNGAPGPQVGHNYPTSGVPTAPADPCGTAFCGGTLFNPNGQDQFQDNVNSPLLNIANAAVNTLLLERKDEEVVKTSTDGTAPGSPSGQSKNGGTTGSTPGNAGRPAQTTVPPTGLGPLPSGMPPLGETRFASNEVVMQLGLNLTPEQVAEYARQYGLEVISSHTISLLGRAVYRFRITGGLSVREAIAGLQSKGANISAQPSYSYELAQTTNRPATQGDSAQYIVPKLSLVEAHSLSTGKNVKIAVIDSEIDSQHPDLAGVITGQFDALPSQDQTPHPHGTGMAGAIGSHQRLLGVAPGARILGIRAFGVSDAGAQGTSMNIVKGLEWAVSQGAQIINMSFAGPRDPILEQAIKTLREKGIILIAAAGNAGPKSPPLFPAADPNVIAVSATDNNDNTYTGAVRGRHVAIAAPGVDILVPAPAGGYQLTTGTSVAAAHMSGVVALMLERNPRLTPAEVRSILSATAKKLPQSRTDVGAGLVDPVQALSKSGPKQAQVR